MDVVYRVDKAVSIVAAAALPLALTGTLQRQRPATAPAVAGGLGQLPTIGPRLLRKVVACGTETLLLSRSFVCVHARQHIEN